MCDKYKASLPKVDEIHEQIAEIDEINENTLSTKITIFSNVKR